MDYKRYLLFGLIVGLLAFWYFGGSISNLDEILVFVLAFVVLAIALKMRFYLRDKIKKPADFVVAVLMIFIAAIGFSSPFFKEFANKLGVNPDSFVYVIFGFLFFALMYSIPMVVYFKLRGHSKEKKI